MAGRAPAAVADPERVRGELRGTGRLVELDGLRALAAVGILVYHCWIFSSPTTLSWNLGPATPFMGPLQSGVTIFFVLSGFLLYLPIARAIVGKRPAPSLARYLRRRALRVLPAYWVVLAASALVLQSALVPSASGGRAAGVVPPLGALTQDFLLVGNVHPSTFGTGILPAWSLTVEACFYLALPLLALAALRLGRGVRGAAGRLAAAALVPATLIAVGVTTNVVAAAMLPTYGPGIGASWHVVLRQSFLAHADLFGIGAAAAVLFALLASDRLPRVQLLLSGAAAGRLLAYAGLPAWVIAYYFLPRYVYDPIVAAFFALGMLRLVVRPRAPGRRSLLSRHWLAACGLGSYSVFLWHYPILTFLSLHGLLATSEDAKAFVANLLLVGALTGAASFLTYRFVERPALRLDDVLRRKDAPLRVVPAQLSAHEPQPAPAAGPAAS